MTREAGTAGQLPPAADRVTGQWRKGGFGSRMYDFIVMHERVADPLGRLMWHNDMSDMYRDIAELGDLPAGSEILDVPCGGGVSFRGLRPGRRVRYVAADISPFMLDRARAEAARRDLSSVEFHQADVRALPFADATFDRCLTYNGLHCFPDPEAAVAEMVRVLRPGGQLRGTAVVTGGGRIPAACIAIFQRAAQFADVGTAEDIERWLAAAGIADPQVGRRGAYAFFSGRKARPEK
ncbi:class I SAM-dependent methyltransferase [Actinomadura sp. 7K534]|uniref:class I SAM-dependent methyltransferase n=1 Tax=Actinomadura sp. 7K534 TaxID=2530366 RepID=UPI00104635D3|nr:class I SAM-dependent methyltransferase [Actinomadura sp. 7K534]TDB97310.1 class I SAM-dependent methyltransferase [Actinomadura sp. 7K534]